MVNLSKCLIREVLIHFELIIVFHKAYELKRFLFYIFILFFIRLFLWLSYAHYGWGDIKHLAVI